ncbi:MAG: pyruvate formate lyase family protein, partial [Pseudomonadota bacterium]
MAVSTARKPAVAIKEPKGLSPRIQTLRDYYFSGVKRPWNNEFTAWTTGTSWDTVYNEATFYIVPEMYTFLSTFNSSFLHTARKVDLAPDFWQRSLPERRAWFIREVMARYLPAEILPGDLLCGGRFNIQASRCLTKKETRERHKLLRGKHGARKRMKAFHDHGYGNAGATDGHLVPGYERVLTEGFSGIHADLEKRFQALSTRDKRGEKGDQLKAMMTAATLPRDLAARYASQARNEAAQCEDPDRAAELQQMAKNLSRVPWEPPTTFWEAVQALWLAHLLVMSDENYPGPGVSFGRVDQYLLPYWQRSVADGMDPEFGKEILKCFWVHANTAYDAMIRTGGNQGITAGFGQLITLSGLGSGGKDMTNELTYV